MKLIAPFGVEVPRRGNDMRHRPEGNEALPSHLPELNEPLPNSFITLRVQEAFAADPALMDTRIAVETFEGIVQLSGVARWRYELSLAEQVAGRIGGVRGIRSCIRLVQTTELSSTVEAPRSMRLATSMPGRAG